MRISMKARRETLRALGVSAKRNKGLYNFSMPERWVLERFAAPKGPVEGQQYVRIYCPEFTSLCPVTGQPDSAEMVIVYRPGKWCVESKSLKLYLMGFRQHGCFHEAIVQWITTDLVRLLDPVWVIVTGKFVARDGIAIHPRSVYVKGGAFHLLPREATER